MSHNLNSSQKNIQPFSLGPKITADLLGATSVGRGEQREGGGLQEVAAGFCPCNGGGGGSDKHLIFACLSASATSRP